MNIKSDKKIEEKDIKRFEVFSKYIADIYSEFEEHLPYKPLLEIDGNDYHIHCEGCWELTFDSGFYFSLSVVEGCDIDIWSLDFIYAIREEIWGLREELEDYE